MTLIHDVTDEEILGDGLSERYADTAEQGPKDAVTDHGGLFEVNYV